MEQRELPKHERSQRYKDEQNKNHVLKTLQSFQARKEGVTEAMKQVHRGYGGKRQRNYKVKTMWKKNTVARFTLPEFTTSYKATVIKTSQCESKDKYIDEWNRTDGLQLDPTKYAQLTFDKRIP